MLYKLDGGIDHVLIDEAQDTSPEQWEIVQQADRGILRRPGARAARSCAPSSRWATRNNPSSASRAPIPRQFDINRRHFAEADRRRRTASAGSAADHLAPLGAGNPAIRGHGVRKRSGARRPDRQRRRRSSIAPIATTAKGGIEFWPALVPGRGRRGRLLRARWMRCRRTARWRGWRRRWRTRSPAG